MRTTGTHVLHPHRHLLVNGVIATLALTTPVFAVAYWLTISGDSWPWVLALHALTAVFVLFLVLLLRRTTVTVSQDSVRERGFLGQINQISNSEIGSICLIEIYRDNALDTQPNLFVLDKSGVVRVRLRGQYWSRTTMEDLAEVLDRPIVNVSDSITLSEMRSSRPEWLYWFERVPLLSWI
ncbi:MAG TPA: hypothetical protein VG369_05655 [Humibacter sp.]|nr:hypothetical protein [Humibacter sp.]